MVYDRIHSFIISLPDQVEQLFQLCVTRPQTTYGDVCSGTISNRENPERMLYSRAQITQISGSIPYTWLSSQNSFDHVHLYAFPSACDGAGEVLMFTFTALRSTDGNESARYCFYFTGFVNHILARPAAIPRHLANANQNN